MAEDKLMLPIGLDIDFDSLEKQWSAKKAELEQMMTLDLKINVSGINTSSLQEVQKELAKVKLEPITPETKDAIGSLVRELRTLEDLLKRIDALNLRNSSSIQKAQREAANTSRATSQAKLAEIKVLDQEIVTRNRAQAAIQKQALYEQQLAAAKIRVQAAEKNLNAARSQSIGIIQSQNNALISQGMALNGLKQFAMQYLSILGAWRVFENIRKTTADFELQRVALRAIIQDKQAADKIFSQTLKLAIESPFTAQELIGYTKQLSAYRLETDKLHDTTKRLADVSAGLGVDMSRLVLAYGQVRAASVLRGQEIRQFTEAGVPLVELLADKFTELKNRVVSTAEVFDLVSKRQVPFQMVADVFEDMTNKGGVFYDMQKVQVETLYGVYRKLGDVVAQSFYKIGEENMGVLKGLGNVLIVLAENMQTLISAGTTLVAGWALMKVALAAQSQVMGTWNTAVLKSIMVSKQKQAQVLSQAASYRTLSAEEARRVQNQTKLLAADIASMRISAEQRKELILRAYATGQLSREELLRARRMQLISAEEARSVTIMSTWQRTLLGARTAVSGLTASLKTLWVTYIANPLTWVMAAFAAITAGVTKLIQKNTELKESIRAIAKEARTALADTRDALGSINENFTPAEIAGEGSVDRTKELIAEYKNIISANETMKNLGKERLKGIIDEVQQLKILQGLAESYQIAMEKVASNPSLASDANSATHSFLGESYKKDARQLADSIEAVGTEINQAFDLDGADEGIRKVRGEFEKLSKDGTTLADKMKFVQEAINTIAPGGWAKDSYNDLYRQLLKVQRQYIEAANGAEKFMEYTKRAVTEINGQKIDWEAPDYGLSPENLEHLRAWLAIYHQSWFDTFSDVEKRGMDMIWELNNQHVTIPMRVTLEPPKKDALDGIKKLIADFSVNGKSGIQLLGFTEDNIRQMSNLDAISKSLNEKFNELTGQINKYNKSLKTGTGITGKAKEDIEGYKEAAEADLEVVTQLAKLIGVVLTLTKDNGGGGADKRTAELQAEISAVKEAYKRYEEYRKIMSDTSAQERILKENKEIFKSFKRLYTEKPGDITPVFDADGLVKVLEQGLKNGQAYLDHKGRLQIRGDISDTTFNDIERKVKQELDRISRNISRQQAANSFFERMLGITGDENISSQLTLSTTGLDMVEVRDELIKSLKTAFTNLSTGEKIDISDAFTVDGGVDKSKLQAIIDDVDFPEKMRANAQSALDALIKYEQDVVASLYQTLGKFDSYEARREQARKKAAADIAKMAQTTAPEATKIAYTEARTKQENKEVAAIDLEAIKNSEDYIKAFEDLDRIGTKTLSDLEVKLRTFLETEKESLEPTQIRELVKTITSLQNQMQERDPWNSFKKGLKEYKEALKELPALEAQYNKDLKPYEDAVQQQNEAQVAYDAAKGTDAETAAFDALWAAVARTNEAFKTLDVSSNKLKQGQNNVNESLEQTKRNLTKLQSNWNKVANVATAAVGLIMDLAEGLGIAFDDDTQEFLDNIGKSLGIVSAGFAFMTAAMELAKKEGESLMATLWPLLAVTVALTAAFTIFGGKQKRLDKRIAASERRVKALEYAYADLERAIDKTLGLDKYKNVGKQAQNLQQQQLELQRQIQLEREKGKKKDEGKIQDLQRQIVEIGYQIEDIFSELRDEVLGGTAQDFAKSLADAMFDALGQGKNAAIDAWNEAIDVIMDNMVRKLLIEKLLEKQIGAAVDKLSASAFDSTGAINLNANNLEAFRLALETIGKNFYDILDNEYLSKFIKTDTDTNLTGISKAVGSLTEDTALTLAGVANSMLYYQVGSYNLLFNMNDIIMRWDLAMTGEEGLGFIPSMIAYQTQAIALMQAIKNDTGRIADATERMADDIGSTISLPGSPTSPRAINVNA